MNYQHAVSRAHGNPLPLAPDSVTASSIAAPLFVSATDIHGNSHVLNVVHIASLQAWPQYFVGIVTLTTEKAIELYRDDFQAVHDAVGAFTMNSVRQTALPARCNFCMVHPKKREEYLDGLAQLFKAAEQGSLNLADKTGRCRCASALFGEEILSWRQLSPEMLHRLAGAIAAGCVLPGWNYIPDLAQA